MTLEAGMEMTEEQVSAHLTEMQMEAQNESAADDDVKLPEEETEELKVSDTQESEEEDSEETSSDEQEPEEDDEPVSYTIEDLAEAMEMSQEDVLAAIRVSAKVDGKLEELNLGELQKGYQREADYTRKTQELAEQRKAVDSLIAQEQEKFTKAHTELAQLIQFNEQSLMADANQTNWEQLRSEDPAEYAARIQDYQARKSQLDQMKQAGIAQWEANQQELKAKADQEFSKRVEEASQALSQALPEWADESRRSKEQKAIGEYLLSHGYTETELSRVEDHRQILIARKAMLFDQMNSKAESVKKKVKKLPKVLKPGARVSKSQQREHALKEKMDRLKKSGSHDALVDYLNARSQR